MSSPDAPDTQEAIAPYTRRARRRVGLLGMLLAAAFIIGSFLTRPNGGSGVTPGQRIAPFAVPLAVGTLEGAANIATRPHDGDLGARPACSVRGGQILNVCELYERGPLVLVLFLNRGSCPNVVKDLQTLAPTFPQVQFAAVAIKGSRPQLASFVRSTGVKLPVGYDEDGVLASLYQMVDCPEITFAYPGGIAASRPLLGSPTRATLRLRVEELLTAARARGWRPVPTAGPHNPVSEPLS
jgi:hypothetical protein